MNKKTHTKNIEEWVKGGVTLFEQKKRQEAIECFERALLIKPDCAEAFYHKGRVLASSEKREEAIECYDQAIKINPNYLEAYAQKGNTLNSLERKIEAQECWKKAVSLPANSKEECRSMGGALFFLNKKDEALQWIDKAIAQDPNHKDAYYSKGYLMLTAGKKQEALKCLEKAIELNSHFAEAHFLKGYVLNLLGKKNEALDAFDKTIALDSEFKDVYLQKATLLSDMNKKDEALECIEKAIVLNPDYSESYRRKGLVYESMKKEKEAMECYDKAIELCPNNPSTYYDKGAMLIDLEKAEEAIQCYNKAISLNGNNALYHYNKGNALRSLKKYEEAMQAFDQAISKNPSFAHAYNSKAILLSKNLNRKLEAIDTYNKAISIEPENPLFLCNRGLCLNGLNREKEAIADFMTANEIIERGKTENLTQVNISYIKKTIKPIIEAQNLASKAEEALLDVDKDLPVVRRYTKNLKQLQEEKNKVTAKLIGDIEKKDKKKGDKYLAELERVKAEMTKEMTLFKGELSKIQKEVKKVEHQVEELKHEMEIVKEELDTKMSDYSQKLDQELAKKDIIPEDKAKITDYYRSFVETFSSIFVTSQVVESGQVQLYNTGVKTTVLSTIATFTPFIGHMLSTGITSVSSFYQSTEMKNYARKIKHMAADTTELSRLVGKSAFAIALNDSKQQQIIKVTNDTMKKASGELFSKISKFCKDVTEDVDTYLYSSLYKSPASRLGHCDANELIKYWIEEKIDPYDIEGDFVTKAVGFRVTP